MKHLRPLSRAPKPASIDIAGLFDTKVETKENVINEKASALS